MQAKRDETTVNRDEMQVRRVYLPLRGRKPGNYPKRRPVVNARGVEDAAPYNYGAWGLLPDYTPISAHSDNKDNYTNALGHDYKEVTTKNAPVHERT